MKRKKFKKIFTGLVTGVLLVVAASVLFLSNTTTTKPRNLRTKSKNTAAAKKAKTTGFSSNGSSSKNCNCENCSCAKTKKTSSTKTTATDPKTTVTKTKTTDPIHNESSQMKTILDSTTGLKPKVLKLGLEGYQWAKQHGDVKKNYLTIIDFSIPSKAKRMWVINLNTDKVVMKTLVANGKYSGLYVGKNFSNRHGSKESSLGVYVTGTTYYGNDGLSLHVKGLQPSINGNAYSRLIEFHGATYVSPAFAKSQGRVGRSWGCFALDKAMLPKVVNTIKDGSVVFAYAIDHPQAFKVERNA